VDNDHDLDIFVTNWLGEPDRLLINNGSGVFNDETISRLPDEPVDRSYGSDAEFGDLDGDEDLDIVVASYTGRNRLLINDGFGKFSDETDSNLPVDGGNSTDLDLGDVDNDGDLDVIIANRSGGEQNRLLMNNSKGVFMDETSLRLPTRSDSSEGVILVDVDGDKDLDIFVANTNEESRLFINDGTGKFSDETANRLPVGTDFNVDVSAGDVDNDGDLDLFVADVGQDELLINDGVGIYTVGEFPTEDDFGSDAEFVDVNSDGNLDLVVANIVLGDNNPQNRLYINTREPLHLSVDSQNTLVVAAPETIPTDGKSISTITITPKDAMGNNLGKDQRVVLNSSAGALLGTVLDKGDGTYTQGLQASSTPETAVITTFINGVKIAQSPQIVFAK
jgi:Invasin, domain 3/FG-GAP-like repeat